MDESSKIVIARSGATKQSPHLEIASLRSQWRYW